MTGPTSEPDAHKELSRTQFGANAANYATSQVHAKGESLARMVQLVEPHGDWKALDVATAAGHTAFAFAPLVASVVATDLTPEMVDLAAGRAVELGHANVIVELADAEALPFDDGTFDLVTCRIAPHHFPNPDRFLGEAARVLRIGGTLALVDNIVPDDLEAARYYNDWERRRDPSHVRALSMREWRRLLVDAGFAIRCEETMSKYMDFGDWVENMSVPEADRPVLLDDLLHAPENVRAFLRPAGATVEDAGFHLAEGIFIATR